MRSIKVLSCGVCNEDIYEDDKEPYTPKDCVTCINCKTNYPISDLKEEKLLNIKEISPSREIKLGELAAKDFERQIRESAMENLIEEIESISEYMETLDWSDIKKHLTMYKPK